MRHGSPADLKNDDSDGEVLQKSSFDQAAFLKGQKGQSAKGRPLDRGPGVHPTNKGGLPVASNLRGLAVSALHYDGS